MARRQVGSTRRVGDGGSFPFAGALHSKSRSSPLLSICLVLVVYFSLNASFKFLNGIVYIFLNLNINSCSSFVDFQGACLLIGYAYSGPGICMIILVYR